MSKSRRPAAQTPGSTAPPAVAVPLADDAPPRSKARLGIGIALWGIWIAALAALAALSANPVTLNSRQFKNADLVIIGHVEEVAAGQVTVVETKLGAHSSKTLTVQDLAGIPGILAGADYLLPLQQSGGEYQVVSTTDDPRGRVVYPATEEVKLQLAKVLGDVGKRLQP